MSAPGRTTEAAVPAGLAPGPTDAVDPRAARALVGVCVGLIAFGLVYTAISLFELPIWTYFPRAARFRWTGPAGPEPMRYYGQVALALLGGGAAGALAWAASWRLHRRGLPATSGWLLVGWLAVAGLGTVAYQLWHNWP